jgi:hypothetical protein
MPGLAAFRLFASRLHGLASRFARPARLAPSFLSRKNTVRTWFGPSGLGMRNGRKMAQALFFSFDLISSTFFSHLTAFANSSRSSSAMNTVS